MRLLSGLLSIALFCFDGFDCLLCFYQFFLFLYLLRYHVLSYNIPLMKNPEIPVHILSGNFMIEIEINVDILNS